MSTKFCGTVGSVSLVVSSSSSEVFSCGSCGAGGCDLWFLTYCKVSFIGDLPCVGLTRLDLSLSMWISMKSASQFSSCDVNVNSAINVLKFQLGRFQNIVMRMRRSICPINPRRAQMAVGITVSHCRSYCRRFWKGMDRLTRDKSVLRCVKLELRYPIIQAIRSQWESQDFPTLGNQYHVTDDTVSQEQVYNTCAPNQG